MCYEKVNRFKSVKLLKCQISEVIESSFSQALSQGCQTRGARLPAAFHVRPAANLLF